MGNRYIGTGRRNIWQNLKIKADTDYWYLPAWTGHFLKGISKPPVIVSFSPSQTDS